MTKIRVKLEPKSPRPVAMKKIIKKKVIKKIKVRPGTIRRNPNSVMKKIIRRKIIKGKVKIEGGSLSRVKIEGGRSLSRVKIEGGRSRPRVVGKKITSAMILKKSVDSKKSARTERSAKSNTSKGSSMKRTQPSPTPRVKTQRQSPVPKRVKTEPIEKENVQRRNSVSPNNTSFSSAPQASNHMQCGQVWDLVHKSKKAEKVIASKGNILDDDQEVYRVGDEYAERLLNASNEEKFKIYEEIEQQAGGSDRHLQRVFDHIKKRLEQNEGVDDDFDALAHDWETDDEDDGGVPKKRGRRKKYTSDGKLRKPQMTPEELETQRIVNARLWRQQFSRDVENFRMVDLTDPNADWTMKAKTSSQIEYIDGLFKYSQGLPHLQQIGKGPSRKKLRAVLEEQFAKFEKIHNSKVKKEKSNDQFYEAVAELRKKLPSLLRCKSGEFRFTALRPGINTTRHLIKLNFNWLDEEENYLWAQFCMACVQMDAQTFQEAWIQTGVQQNIDALLEREESILMDMHNMGKNKILLLALDTKFHFQGISAPWIDCIRELKELDNVKLRLEEAKMKLQFSRYQEIQKQPFGEEKQWARFVLLRAKLPLSHIERVYKLSQKKCDEWSEKEILSYCPPLRLPLEICLPFISAHLKIRLRLLTFQSMEDCKVEVSWPSEKDTMTLEKEVFDNLDEPVEKLFQSFKIAARNPMTIQEFDQVMFLYMNRERLRHFAWRIAQVQTNLPNMEPLPLLHALFTCRRNQQKLGIEESRPFQSENGTKPVVDWTSPEMVALFESDEPIEKKAVGMTATSVNRMSATKAYVPMKDEMRDDE